MKKVKLLLIITISIIIAIIIGYLGYVLVTYERIEDNLVLDVSGNSPDNEVVIGQEYTVITQNCGFGAYTSDFSFFMDGGKESRAASAESVVNCITQLTDTINSRNPDFILLQELDLDSTRSYHIDEKKIVDDMVQGYSSIHAINYNSPYLMYPVTKPHGASKSCIATYSRVGIEQALRKSLPIATDFHKIVDLDRCYSKSWIPVSDGKKLVLYNVHLSAYIPGEFIREQQIEMLIEDIQREYEAGNYCVCGGDFNSDLPIDSAQRLNINPDLDVAWDSPFPVEYLTDNVIRCVEYTGGEYIATCRNCDKPYGPDVFTIIVDGFLVTDNVQVTYLENIDAGFKYSDHNPVIMKFILE